MLAEDIDMFRFIALWYTRIYIVANAFDECLESAARDKFLRSMILLRPTLDIRMFVTTRPITLLVEIGEEETISIDAGSRMRDDIGKYLDDRKSELRAVTEDGNWQHIRNVIVNKANGM